MRDPLSFSREEGQQAGRAYVNPREIKAALQDAGKRSDNRASFEAALKDRGVWLAKGERWEIVVLDCRGEVSALSRYAGGKT